MTMSTPAKKSGYCVGISCEENVQNEKQKKKNSSTATIPLGAVAYSKWAGRFTWTAIIQGAIVALLTYVLAAFAATTGYPLLLVQAMLSIPKSVLVK
jgi:uncharacterized integral membrane protein